MLENHVDFIYVHKRGSILWMNFFSFPLSLLAFISKTYFPLFIVPFRLVGMFTLREIDVRSLVSTQSEIKGKMHWIKINYNLNKVINLNTRLLSMSPQLSIIHEYFMTT